MPVATLTPADAHSAMLVAWHGGSRRHAGLLARVLLRDLSIYTRRVWYANAIAISRATRAEFPGEVGSE